MRKSLPIRLRSLAAITLALAMLASMTACLGGSHTENPEDTTAPTQEAVTLPSITIPDLTDDRTPTNTADYAERVESLFSTTAPVPAADLTYEITDDGVTITGYTGGELVVAIPDTIEDKPVTAIAANAFKDMGNLKALSIPASVTSIGKSALAGCKSLTSLKTPVYTCEDAPYFGALFGASSHETNGGSVPVSLSTLVITGGETVPDYTFYACRGLEAVALPETLTEIGAFAFYGCEALTYITTADTALTTVGDRAFSGCIALLDLTLPATVTYMGVGMLEGCGKLESLTIPFVGSYTADYPLTEEDESPESSAYLGYLFGAAHYTFSAGYIPASLITVTLTEGCTAIPANAFFECASIREVVIPEGVTEINRRAFYGCEKLSAVTLPDSVTTIGDDAFHGCIRLQRFTGGAGLTELGMQTFMNCVSLKTVTLPETVTHLPNSCFSGCLSLTTLQADGVETKGDRVFYRCEKLKGWDK